MYLEQVLQKLRNRYFVTITKMVLNLTNTACHVVLYYYHTQRHLTDFTIQKETHAGAGGGGGGILAAFQPVPP